MMSTLSSTYGSVHSRKYVLRASTVGAFFLMLDRLFQIRWVSSKGNSCSTNFLRPLALVEFPSSRHTSLLSASSFVRQIGAPLRTLAFPATDGWILLMISRCFVFLEFRFRRYQALSVFLFSDVAIGTSDDLVVPLVILLLPSSYVPSDLGCPFRSRDFGRGRGRGVGGFGGMMVRTVSRGGTFAIIQWF